MSHPLWQLDQVSYGLVTGEEPIFEQPSRLGFEEDGEFPAMMSPALPSPSQEPLSLEASYFRNAPLTQGSSESGNSEWARSSVLGYAERPLYSFSSDMSPHLGFDNLDHSPIMPSSFNTSDALGYFNSYNEPCYTQSIVSSPGPFCPQPNFSADVQAPHSTMLPAGRPYNSPTGLNGHGSRQYAGQASEPQSSMKLNPRSHPSAPSIDADDEVMLVCCDHQFSSKSSFDRHRKDSCKTFRTAGKRFQCDPRIHCQKAFRRRCGLKKHLEKVGLSEARVDEVVRQKYGMGMRRRSD